MIKTIFNFIFKIPSFFRFYRDYGYCGDAVRFIIEQYEEVLCNRTKFMSKPTYVAEGVIRAIDEWYEDEDD